MLSTIKVFDWNEMKISAIWFIHKRVHAVWAIKQYTCSIEPSDWWPWNIDICWTGVFLCRTKQKRTTDGKVTAHEKGRTPGFTHPNWISRKSTGSLDGVSRLNWFAQLYALHFLPPFLCPSVRANFGHSRIPHQNAWWTNMKSLMESIGV